MASPGKISITEFKDALSRYPTVVGRLYKPPKPGALSLEELDQFRYVDAPASFSKSSGNRQMRLEDIQKLVDWKLSHGKFRPSLSKLVASNPPSLVEETTDAAFSHYNTLPTDVSTVISKISGPLKGIGPATASLILAVHDPDQIIFFGDEVFRWLCADGRDVSIKYNIKEYQEIYANSCNLMSRLKVNALEIEKVAYVLIKEGMSNVTKHGTKRKEKTLRISKSAKHEQETSNKLEIKPSQSTVSVRASKRKPPHIDDGTIDQTQAHKRQKQ